MVVVVAVGPAAWKFGGRNCQGGENFACAHTHDAVSLQGSITRTIAHALLDNARGYAGSQGHVGTARAYKHAYAAGAGAYRSRFAVDIDF